MEAATLPNDQAVINGTVKFVSPKTQGIILENDPQTWYNPVPSIKDQVTPDLKGRYVSLILEGEGKTRVVGIGYPEAPTPVEDLQDETPATVERPSGTTKAVEAATALQERAAQIKAQAAQQVKNREAQKKGEAGTGLELARKLGLITQLNGKEYIGHVGLNLIAHKMGLQSTNTELLTSYELSLEKKSALVKATVTFKDPETFEIRTFTGIGDSNPQNTNKTIQDACIRMAETRALNRALRDGTQCGLTSLEEMPDAVLPEK